MNILIAGGSGFIGSALIHILKKNHTITVLGRDEKRLKRQFPQNINITTWDALPKLDAHAYDVVMNLCGYNISASRWSNSVKKKIIRSRVDTTTTLIDWAIKQQAKPRFFCANAIGIYGIQNKEDQSAFDETSPINWNHPHDFLNETGILWQGALQPAIDFGIPVTITRFGVVLKKGEGILKKLEFSFKLGLGAVLGDGKQVISWVHESDIVNALIFLLEKPQLVGAFNITSPHPVSQKEFASILAKSMHRPLLLRMPGFVVRLLFGEMGECLLLGGQRVLPQRLLQEGYSFRFLTLEDALAHENLLK